MGRPTDHDTAACHPAIGAHVLDKLEALIAQLHLDRATIQDAHTDLDERDALELADLEATENFYLFMAELWKPFDSELPQTPYQVFCARRDAYIAGYAKQLREGNTKNSILAAWLLLNYGTDEQADAFMQGTEEKRSKLLKLIIEKRGMVSAMRTWVELV